MPFCLIAIILMAILLTGCMEAEDTEAYDEVHGQVERTWTEGEYRHIDLRVMKLEGTYKDHNAYGPDISSGDRVHLYYNRSKNPEFEGRVEEGNYLLVDFVHRPDEDPEGVYLVRNLEQTSHPYLGDGILIVLILLGVSYIVWTAVSKLLYLRRNPGQYFIPPETVPIDCPVCGEPSSIIVRLPLGSWTVRVKSRCRTCKERLILYGGRRDKPLWRTEPLWKRVVILVLAIISLPITLWICLYILFYILYTIALLLSSLFAMIGSSITFDTIYLLFFLFSILFFIAIMRMPAYTQKLWVQKLDMEIVRSAILERSASMERTD